MAAKKVAKGPQLDLVHLAIMLGKEFPGSEIESAGLDVAAAVDAAVVRNVHSIEHPNSHGMTIFFPPTREIFEDDVDVSYRWIEYSRRGRWCRWLADYVEQAEQQRFHPLLQELRVTSTRVSKKHPISVVSGVQHDQYAEVYLAVAGAAEHDRTVLCNCRRILTSSECWTMNGTAAGTNCKAASSVCSVPL